jgi:hypothetical protein
MASADIQEMTDRYVLILKLSRCSGLVLDWAMMIHWIRCLHFGASTLRQLLVALSVGLCGTEYWYQ